MTTNHGQGKRNPLKNKKIADPETTTRFKLGTAKIQERQTHVFSDDFRAGHSYKALYKILKTKAVKVIYA